MPHVIVSYDGTRNDRDGLALGRLFAAAGADVSLAYVRHARDGEPEREAAAQADAEHLLAAGASQLDGRHVRRYVTFNRSTAAGLATLAAELGADVIAFGSSYRTPAGQVAVPHTAQQLLDGGAAWSLALAPAGLRREPVERSIGTIGVWDEDRDAATHATAESLAHALGAVVTEAEADLLVVASRPDAPPGQLLLSGSGRERLEEAECPVLALAHASALQFG
jgi:nucleotide-binding universal stress UspA family protein